MAIEIQIRVTIENPPDDYEGQSHLAERLKRKTRDYLIDTGYEVSKSSAEVVNILDNEIVDEAA